MEEDHDQMDDIFDINLSEIPDRVPVAAGEYEANVTACGVRRNKFLTARNVEKGEPPVKEVYVSLTITNSESQFNGRKMEYTILYPSTPDAQEGFFGLVKAVMKACDVDITEKFSVERFQEAVGASVKIRVELPIPKPGKDPYPVVRRILHLDD